MVKAFLELSLMMSTIKLIFEKIFIGERIRDIKYHYTEKKFYLHMNIMEKLQFLLNKFMKI